MSSSDSYTSTTLPESTLKTEFNNFLNSFRKYINIDEHGHQLPIPKLNPTIFNKKVIAKLEIDCRL